MERRGRRDAVEKSGSAFPLKADPTQRKDSSHVREQRKGKAPPGRRGFFLCLLYKFRIAG
jgi:hypothetical protein